MDFRINSQVRWTFIGALDTKGLATGREINLGNTDSAQFHPLLVPMPVSGLDPSTSHFAGSSAMGQSCTMDSNYNVYNRVGSIGNAELGTSVDAA